LFNIYHSGNDEINAAEALRMIAENHFNMSSYIEAMDYFERSLDICKKTQFFEGIAMALSGMARIHSHWGEYDEALGKNQDALRFWEEIGNQEGIASQYSGIGQIYEELENYERAFEYFKKSLDIYKELNHPREIVQLTLSIGDIYLRKLHFDKALEYYFKAEEIGKKINNKKLKATTLSNIGEAYNKKGDYIKALDYQNQSLRLKEEIGDKKLLSITYTELGLIYCNVEEFKKAISYMQKALDVSTDINFRYQINKCNFHLSEIYEKTGHYRLALEAYREYIAGKENINSEEKQQIMAELQAKYQVEKKEKENERLRHVDDLNSAQIRTQQLIIGFVLFILLGTFVLSLVFHSRYQQNRGLNIQLSLKNKEIEEQQRNVEKLNAELKEANTTKDKFFSIVAHDLKNPFNSLLVLSKLLLDDYDTFTDDERIQFIQQIKSSAENTYSLLQNLLEWASAQSGKAVIIKEQIDLAKLSQEAIILLKPIAKNKKISLDSHVNRNTLAYADKNMISTVLLNLVSNAVKFTQHSGTIEVKAIEKNNHVEVEISDTGIGISEENMAKLFKPDVKFHTMGTDKEKGTGLGLLLCKEFVEKNDGSIWVESTVGKGSSFHFSLPKS
jgi:signal transduction histidine kinase